MNHSFQSQFLPDSKIGNDIVPDMVVSHDLYEKMSVCSSEGSFGTSQPLQQPVTPGCIGVMATKEERGLPNHEQDEKMSICGSQYSLESSELSQSLPEQNKNKISVVNTKTGVPNHEQDEKMSICGSQYSLESSELSQSQPEHNNSKKISVVNKKRVSEDTLDSQETIETSSGFKEDGASTSTNSPVKRRKTESKQLRALGSIENRSCYARKMKLIEKKKKESDAKFGIVSDTKKEKYDLYLQYLVAEFHQMKECDVSYILKLIANAIHDIKTHDNKSLTTIEQVIA